ncbi:MAG TPA: aminodeoxychorismate synthase component I [Solirubrobacterales bacterium]|nr:aminodeoxychorismate synthase component I [Solirubrobacterales bacterium]
MQTLLIDNYDSFTYNLFQLLAEVNGREPIVVRNDEASWAELERLDFDNVVISPGPGRPQEAGDFGVCTEAIRRCERPLLGVCLGMQGMGWVEGGRVERAPEPMHGRVVSVEHDGSGLFAGIPSPFNAVRYHSLALAHPLPPSLREIAACDGVPMAVAHRTRPQWGVQFHPESIATEHGASLLANFRDLTPAPSRGRGAFVSPEVTKAPRPRMELRVRRLDALPDPEAAFVSLYAESEHAFWLDSSRAGERGRFSFMGDASGPLAEVVTHDIDSGEPILDYLQRRTEELRPATPPDLPFEFDCGFVGYLGYELKAECGHAPGHPSGHPDAAFVLADRVIALDHEASCTYLLALHKASEEGEEVGADGAEWISTTASRLETLSARGEPGAGSTCNVGPAPGSPPSAMSLARSREQYLEDVEASIDHLLDGDSYEICLTNKLGFETDADPLDLYRHLRRANPAPFAAYLRFGEMAILSSSPERFLRVSRDGVAEARPIKGTSRRGAGPEEDARLAVALAADEKNRAENLMIVDLLRNDLGAVCEVGSVEVPAMMAVESYETVHQLVSAVRGRLRPGAGAADCVRSCFPPGSMTGAPKLRTTAILDELEGAARGVYSGAIGWFGLGGGADLAVAIRTIVLAGGRAEIGAGGAVVLQSDPRREFEEMLLKAAAPLRAIDSGADPASISLAVQGAAAASPP